jgi:N-carbamoylputrescine amidase
MEFSGESFVSDPDGIVIARAALQQDQILYADLDLSLIQNSHARRLFWRHRRPELYSRWLNPAG